MKKLISLMTTLVLICAMALPTFAVQLPAYDGDYEGGPAGNMGYLFANKYDTILAGKAGTEEDDVNWVIPGVKGDQIPTLDGEATANEGYQNFENFEDYLSIACYQSGADGFQDWYDEVSTMDITVKTCWDGTYLYAYFEYALKDYQCHVTAAQNMWMWPCVQFAVANPDATGTDRAELGYTVTNDGNNLCCAWSGKFSPTPKEDFVGTATDIGGGHRVKLEFRILLTEALGRQEALKSLDHIRMSWIISGMHGNMNQQRIVEFTAGICSNTPGAMGKQAQIFADVMLGEGNDTGEDAKEPCYKPTEDDLMYDFNATSSIFFEDIVGKNDFTSENGVSYEYAADNKYITVISPSEYGFMYSEGRFPVQLGNHPSVLNTPYALIKYRTSDEGMTLGMNCLNGHMQPEPGETEVKYSEDNVVYAELDLITDGEWHYAVIDLSACPAWGPIISTVGIEVGVGKIDLEGIRFYGSDPSDLYVEDPAATETESDATAADTTTAAPDTTAVPETTGAADTTAADTTVAETEAAKKSGCGSVIAGGAAALIAALSAGFVLCKKKED